MGARTFYVYILANSSRKVLYLGVTNNLQRRLEEHQSGLNKEFTKRYNVHYLMYYETLSKAMQAIKREKQIKKWYRYQKDELITRFNPEWKDLTNYI